MYTDHCFSSGLLAYEQSANDFDTVPMQPIYCVFHIANINSIRGMQVADTCMCVPYVYHTFHKHTRMLVTETNAMRTLTAHGETAYSLGGALVLYHMSQRLISFRTISAHNQI